MEFYRYLVESVIILQEIKLIIYIYNSVKYLTMIHVEK